MCEPWADGERRAPYYGAFHETITAERLAKETYEALGPVLAELHRLSSLSSGLVAVVSSLEAASRSLEVAGWRKYGRGLNSSSNQAASPCIDVVAM